MISVIQTSETAVTLSSFESVHLEGARLHLFAGETFLFWNHELYPAKILTLHKNPSWHLLQDGLALGLDPHPKIKGASLLSLPPCLHKTGSDTLARFQDGSMQRVSSRKPFGLHLEISTKTKLIPLQLETSKGSCLLKHFDAFDSVTTWKLSHLKSEDKAA